MEFLSSAKQFDDRRLLKTKLVWCELSRRFHTCPWKSPEPCLYQHQLQLTVHRVIAGQPPSFTPLLKHKNLPALKANTGWLPSPYKRFRHCDCC